MHTDLCVYMYSMWIVTNILSFVYFKIIERNIYLLGRQLVIGYLGHFKDLGRNAKSSRSNQTFGTANYLAPEAHDLRRSNKTDIWSFGCIAYELFNLGMLFNIRNPDKLRTSILNFRVETHFEAGKIKPSYIGVVKKYLFLFRVRSRPRFDQPRDPGEPTQEFESAQGRTRCIEPTLGSTR